MARPSYGELGEGRPSTAPMQREVTPGSAAERPRAKPCGSGARVRRLSRGSSRDPGLSFPPFERLNPARLQQEATASLRPRQRDLMQPFRIVLCRHRRAHAVEGRSGTARLLTWFASSLAGGRQRLSPGQRIWVFIYLSTRTIPAGCSSRRGRVSRLPLCARARLRVSTQTCGGGVLPRRRGAPGPGGGGGGGGGRIHLAA